MLKRTKVALFVLCLLPAAWLLIATFMDRLSANPIREITLETGDWTLRFLLITLCITPIRKLTGWNNVVKYRRMLGLSAFFYGFLHFATYASLDQFFSISDMIRDISKRPFITAGFTGFAAMVPLAITSTKRWIVRLGGKQWQRLHRLTYASAIAGVVHYFWLVKADTLHPLLYGALLSVLLAYRAFAPLPAPASATTTGPLNQLLFRIRSAVSRG
jgi:sulfoxide reductase heme-binding subunit YedZ